MGDKAVLVGHSYAGMVISGAVKSNPTTVQSLVFLDAFIPEDDVLSRAPATPFGSAGSPRMRAAFEERDDHRTACVSARPLSNTDERTS